jgi:uncharacterized DUF497 family protein
MKPIRWNEEKNQLLILQRGVSFEQVLEALERREILARRRHHDPQKYPNQCVFILELDGYIYYVPFVETDEEIFLKTIIPSRKLKKEFTGEKHEEE